MSARYVPAELLRTILDEMEKDCTLDRFHEWYRSQIAAQIRQSIPQPKADKWDVFGNRSITYRFNEACTQLIRNAWVSHRKMMRDRNEKMIIRYAEQHYAQHGDALLMEAGGSTEEMVTWMLKEIAGGQCPCSRDKRAKERERIRESASSLLSGESFARWVIDSIDSITEGGPSKTLEEAREMAELASEGV